MCHNSSLSGILMHFALQTSAVDTRHADTISAGRVLTNRSNFDPQFTHEAPQGLIQRLLLQPLTTSIDSVVESSEHLSETFQRKFAGASAATQSLYSPDPFDRF